ncbi:MAG: DUF2079 domain-containing protein [Patescibacteria group bacterium]
MKNRFLSLLKFFVGWPLALLALVFIAQLIIPQAETIAGQMQHLNYTLLIYGVGASITYYFLRSYLWYRLLHEYGHKISFKESTYLWSLSEVKRYIPGNVWSFLSRAVLFGEKDIPKRDIGACLILEASFFVWGSIIISLISIPFINTLFSLNLSFVWLSLFVTLGIALYSLNHSVVRYLPQRIRHAFTFILPKFAPFVILELILIGTITMFFFGLGSYLTISSYLLIEPQLAFSFSSFSVFAFLVGYLSLLTPAGFGVREGVLLAALIRISGWTSAAAAFATLFSRLLLILSELLFIGLTILWSKIQHPSLKKFENNITKHSGISIVATMVVFYCLYFVPITFLRYDNFNTGKFDLGNMSQTVWNTIHGRFFLLTNPDGTNIISRLGVHSDFILVLLAPFYALWQNPKMLLLIQTIILAAGAIFVYLIARDVLKNRFLPLVFSFMYLINPALQRTNLYDFHAVTLATTFFLGTYYFYRKKQYLYFGIFAVLAALCKEQLWVILALFGVFIAVFQRKWILGASITAFCLAMFYIIVWVAIPNALGANHFALSFFAELGDSPTEVVATVLFSPWKVWDMIVVPSKLDYLEQIFSPLGYVSLLGSLWLLFAIPDLLINLLSSNANFHQIYYQYTATITPFLFIAAIHGTRVLQHVLSVILSATKWSRRMTINLIISIYLISMSLQAAYLYGPLPGTPKENITMITETVADRKFIEKYLESIPKESKIAATNQVASHLTHRQYLYVLPNGVDEADMVVFLLIESYTRERELQLIKELKDNKQFKLVVDSEPFVVFKRITR